MARFSSQHIHLQRKIAEVSDKDQSMIVIEMLRRRRPELAIVREAASRAQPAQPKEPLA